VTKKDKNKVNSKMHNQQNNNDNKWIIPHLPSREIVIYLLCPLRHMDSTHSNAAAMDVDIPVNLSIQPGQMTSFMAPLHLSAPQTSWPQLSLTKYPSIKIHWSIDPFCPPLQYNQMRLVLHNTSQTHFTTSLAYPLQITITAYTIQALPTQTHIRVIPTNQGPPFPLPDNALPKPHPCINDLPIFFSKNKQMSKEMDNYIHQLVTNTGDIKTKIQFLASPDPWQLQHEAKPACCLPPTCQLFPMPEKDTQSTLSTNKKLTTNPGQTKEKSQIPMNYPTPLHVNWMQLDLTPIEEEETLEKQTTNHLQQPLIPDQSILDDIPVSEFNSWTNHYLKNLSFPFDLDPNNLQPLSESEQ
jgi:hypothetical protein